MHVYAIIIMIISIMLIIAGLIVSMYIISPIMHKAITMRRDMHRAMDAAVVRYINTMEEGK